MERTTRRARPRRLELPALVEIVTGLAAAPDIWRPHVAHDAVERARVRLLATPAYEVWLLGWTPGQSVGAHDHGGANGAFVVVDGELVESVPSPWGGLRRRLRPGDLGHVTGTKVHDVANRSPRDATSLHAYSPPLRRMRFYGDDGRPDRTETVAPQSAVVPAARWPRPLRPAPGRAG